MAVPCTTSVGANRENPAGRATPLPILDEDPTRGDKATPVVDSDNAHAGRPPNRASLGLGDAVPLSVSTPRDSATGESAEACEARVKAHYTAYFDFSQQGAALRGKHGPLRIAAFSRLWPPPIHGTGGMQYHAMHLYSQFAALGHLVHVFVTGGPGQRRTFYFDVNADTLALNLVERVDNSEGHGKNGAAAVSDAARQARLVVHQVPSDKNAEYSEAWYEACLTEFVRINATLRPQGASNWGGFHVAHSESWGGVPNVYQIGLQMAVTWHGSMLDWFRNEVNLIVHNFRMKRKMTGEKTAHRMSGLGSSVAYEAYSLHTVPHHVVISDSAAADLEEINLVDRDRIHLIYNGVNANNFRPGDEAERVEYLKSVGADPSHFVVGCGGRLEGIKGHHQLSKAMELLLRKHGNITLLVAGSGGEGQRYEQLLTQGLRVVMLGMLKQEKLAAFYRSIDVFVDPFYQHHGLNTVMIEAVLSGVPIVATRLASASTTAPCSQYGRTFALGKVDELAAEIEFLFLRPLLRKAIGRSVRERATRLFTSAVMAGSYESLLYNMWLKPVPLERTTGKVVCKHTYPAMCFREPS